MFLSSGLKNGFTPTSLSGCQQWLDYTDVGSLTLSGTAITNIADKSGHGRDLPQSTGSYQPSLGGSLSSILRCGVFDNDHMGPSASADMDLTSGYTLFIVGSVSNKKSFNGWYRVAAALVTSPSHVEIYEGTGAHLIITNRGTTTDNRYIRNNFSSNGDNHIYTYRPQGTNPADMEILINDIDRTYTSGGSNMYPNSAGYIWAGIGYGNITTGNLQGTISEIIVYDRELEEFEVYLVHEYLSKKHNISLSKGPAQYSGLSVWYDHNYEDSVIVSGSSVTNLYSLADTAGADLDQGTASRQPSYVSSVVNGKNVIRFDGSDTLATPVEYTDLYNSQIAIAVVANDTSGASARGTLISQHYNGTAGTFYVAIDGGSADDLAFITVNSSSVRVNGDADILEEVEDFHAYICNYNGSSMTLYSNGNLLQTLSQTGTLKDDNDRLEMGAVGDRVSSYQFLTGDIAYVLIFREYLTVGEIEALNEFLMNEYSL